jgi:cysteine desulfurase
LAFSEALEKGFGNAHSIHEAGQSARWLVEQAREHLAVLIGAEDSSEIVFTSGATESNNWVLSAFSHIAISPFEHSSIREPAVAAGAKILKNESYQLSPLSAAIELMSVMSVNNETGAILEVPEVLPETRLHRDITQQVGKMPTQLDAVDFASFSAHKFGALKGVGALYVRNGVAIEPLLLGGGQEQGRRAGTLNVPGIVALGQAAAIALGEIEPGLALAASWKSFVASLTGDRPVMRLLRPIS